TGIMSKVDHFSALKQIVEYFSEKNVIYISHRRENRKNLDEISQSLNIKVCHFDYPLEFQLAMIGPRPVIVASFVSSVIENLRLIMGNDLKIVSFKFRPGTYKYQERIDATYTYYEKNLGDNFCVVPLN
ncbi:MAG: hypothetical protein OEY61_12870, partial [Gammaproteobacteria bacterium]|nr:hypothetical protein [Gammaproteobacteria bacterium]